MSEVVNNYEIHVTTVERVPTAIVRGRSRRAEMGKNIRALFDQLYADPPPGVPRGLNVVFYSHTSGEPIPPEGIAMEVGVRLTGPCAAHGRVECSSTPAGEVATVTHWGDYGKLGDAYDALMKWSKETGRKFAGPFWEVYGHWSDDPAQVRTDVFQLLK
jgi:effector-binding domain-containing protein